jgi:hypothetical protein
LGGLCVLLRSKCGQLVLWYVWQHRLKILETSRILPTFIFRNGSCSGPLFCCAGNRNPKWIFLRSKSYIFYTLEEIMSIGYMWKCQNVWLSTLHSPLFLKVWNPCRSFPWPQNDSIRNHRYITFSLLLDLTFSLKVWLVLSGVKA